MSRRFITTELALATIMLLLYSAGTPTALVASPQGKGGTIKPVPTPTPVPKKATPQRSTQTPTRANAKTGQPARSKEDEAAATERTYWETIRNSTDPEDFRAYLKKYPAGQFADLANNRIRALEAAKAQPSPTPAPTPAPEPAYEWTKSERDLPAPVRVVWREKTEGDKSLSFSIPSGWTRSEQKEGKHYLQINFRAPNSPQTNISIQIYSNGVPRTLRNGAAELWFEEKKLIDYRRSQYASQNVSAKLTEDEVINHPTGRWHTFTADVLDVSALERSGGLIPALDAAYPDDVWEEYHYPEMPGQSFYRLKPSTFSMFTRTRHSYAIRQAGSDFIVMLYTAPIEQFDEKMLPSVMATMKMSGSEIIVKVASSDSSVSLAKEEPEILIDGVKIDLRCAWCLDDVSSPVIMGRHHITVRAKEHKPFEKDVSVGGWEELKLEVKLERVTGLTSGATPK